MKKLFLIIFGIGILAFVLSCKTTSAPAEVPAEEHTAVQPAVKPAVKPAEPVKKEPAEVIEKPEGEYVLDEATYKQTKEDLTKLISTLNSIIAAKDYETWLTYLTKKYYDYYSDPEVLKEQSESPLLKKYNIVLRSLKDYFNYVVVGSRKNVRLDEIKAIDADHIKAYMYVNDTPVIIYELVKVDGNWKITHF